MLALLLFPTFALLAASLNGLFSGEGLELYNPALESLLGASILIPLGEEFGWRGFALPRLQKRFTVFTASLILGLLWGLWHFPAFLIGTGVPLETPFVIFLAWVLSATLLMTWVYNHMQSVLATMIMHASANATFNILPLLPEHTGQLMTFLLFIALSWGLVLLLKLRIKKFPAT